MSSLKYKNILVFDTETTGLIPKTKDCPFPYITQMSFIIYDSQTETIRSTFDSFIRIPRDIEIPTIVTELTGITKEKCDKGIDIETALGSFYHAMTLCDCIIGHNIEFDIKMMNIEINRNINRLSFLPNIEQLFHENRLRLLNIQLDCTMRMSIEDCCLYRTNDKNKTYKKFPKLAET